MNGPLDPKERRETLCALYKENGEMYRTFLEWRHKVLLRFGVAAALLLLLCSQVLVSVRDVPNRGLIIGLLILGVVPIATFCWWMDRKNALMLHRAEVAGKAMEKQLAPDESQQLFYTNMVLDDDIQDGTDKPRLKRATYNQILSVLYPVVALWSASAGAVVQADEVPEGSPGLTHLNRVEILAAV